MLQFTTTIQKFDEAGEKTGWTYIHIPQHLAQELKPNNKKAFRVKGKLDHYKFEGISLVPIGEGNFIMALNAALRKQIKKGKGATLQVQLELDHKEILPPEDLLECLADEPTALHNFNKLPKSHQNYYTRWINEAKTEPTRIKRITKAVLMLSKGGDFGDAVRAAGKQTL